MNGWEGQRGKRVLYRGRVMRLVHADLYRVVLETVGDTPDRIVVEEVDWPFVELLDSTSSDAVRSEAAWAR